MKDLEIQLTAEDVTVEAIDDNLCECEEAAVSHYVFVDYRSAGMKVAVGRYCRECADATAAAIKDGLP